MHAQEHTTSAAELKRRLASLHAERALAALTGLTANGLYAADLEDELSATRSAFVGAAVVEIATLRAALDAPLVG
jgi:hypothetical protein